jgi:hypothetical protein
VKENKTSKEWFDIPRSLEQKIKILYQQLEQKYYYFKEDAPQTSYSSSEESYYASSSVDDGWGAIVVLGMIVLGLGVFFSPSKAPDGMQYFDEARSVIVILNKNGTLKK